MATARALLCKGSEGGSARVLAILPLQQPSCLSCAAGPAGASNAGGRSLGWCTGTSRLRDTLQGLHGRPCCESCHRHPLFSWLSSSASCHLLATTSRT